MNLELAHLGSPESTAQNSPTAVDVSAQKFHKEQNYNYQLFTHSVSSQQDLQLLTNTTILHTTDTTSGIFAVQVTNN